MSDLLTNLNIELSEYETQLNRLEEKIDKMMDRFGRNVVDEVFPGNTLSDKVKEDILFEFYEWLGNNHPEYCMYKISEVIEKRQLYGNIATMVTFGMVPNEDGIMESVSSTISTLYEYLKEYLNELSKEDIS